MNSKLKKAITETLADLIEGGAHISFTQKELNDYGIKIPMVKVESNQIQSIRRKIRLSQTVFAKVLNVSPSSVRHWEQGTRIPTGSTKVLLDLLNREPHILNYLIGSH